MPLLGVHDFPDVLGQAESWLLHLGALAYVLASAMALIGLFRRTSRIALLAHVCALGGVVLFAAYFAMRFAADGVAPLRNIFEILLLIAMCLIGGYFAFMAWRPLHALSAWVFPLALMIVVTALPTGGVLGPASANGMGSSQGLVGALLLVHILLAVCATALLTFAFVTAVVYLLQDRALRQKRDSRLLRSLPPVESLRALLNVAVTAGLWVMTASLILGFCSIWGQFGEWFRRPVVLTGLAMWLVFLVAVLGRNTRLLHGKRSVYLVVVGFVLVMLAYVSLGSMPRGDDRSGETGGDRGGSSN